MIEEAKALCKEILCSTSGFTYTVFQSTLLRITLAVNLAIEALEKNNGLSLSSDFSTFMVELSKLDMD